ncbi:MAG TPA: hypothetical protein VFN78_07480 [Ktedonobacterales bacterium]|nr:hypothetical protein [Ktedonobacterales bacterium]
MNGRRARGAALALLLAWGLAGCALSAPIGPATTAPTPTVSLAQRGGLSFMLQVECPNGQACAYSNGFAQMMAALLLRARSGLGVADASVKRVDGTTVEVDLPGYTNQALASQALTTPGSALFIETNGVPLTVGSMVTSNQYAVLFTGSQIDPASVSVHTDPQTGEPIVAFAFKGAAATEFAQYTGAHIGEYLTITVDNKVIESATIQSQISGDGQVTGSKSLADAQALAVYLKSSPLPLSAREVSATLVTPSAG